MAGGVGHGSPPELDRPLAVLLVLETAGIAALLWTAHRFDLSDPQRRRVFMTTGRLTRPSA